MAFVAVGALLTIQHRPGARLLWSNTWTMQNLPSNQAERRRAPWHHAYEVRPRRDTRGFDLICDVLPFRLWYAEPNAVNNAVDYAEHRSRSHYAVIRVVMTLAT